MMRTDHILHALATFAIAMVVTSILHACGVAAASVWGAGIAVLAGLGKEAWDYFSKKGTPEFSDIVADLFGIMAAIVCFMCLWL